MAFTYDLAQVSTSPLHAARNILGDVDASAFALHDEEINAALSAMAARQALIHLARQLRTRYAQRATSSAAGPFRKSYEDRSEAINALVADLRSIPLPAPFSDGSANVGASDIAVTQLESPDLSEWL